MPLSVYNMALIPSVLLPVGALTLVYYWKNISHWTRHPIAKRLSAYTNSDTNPTWVHVLREVIDFTPTGNRTDHTWDSTSICSSNFWQKSAIF